MGHVYQATSFQLGQEVVTVVVVANSAIATDEMASRSMSQLKPYFPKTVLVLACQGVGLTPQFIGPKHAVEVLRGKALSDFKWSPIAIS